jgi:hypothetical protein
MAIEYDDASQIAEGAYFKPDVLISIVANMAQELDSLPYKLATELVARVRKHIDGELSDEAILNFLELAKYYHQDGGHQETELLLVAADVIDFLACHDEDTFLKVLVRCASLAGGVHKEVGQQFYLRWSKQVHEGKTA